MQYNYLPLVRLTENVILTIASAAVFTLEVVAATTDTHIRMDYSIVSECMALRVARTRGTSNGNTLLR